MFRRWQSFPYSVQRRASRDRAVTETTRVLHLLFQSLSMAAQCVFSAKLRRVVSVTQKAVTSPNPLKMAGSLLLRFSLLAR